MAHTPSISGLNPMALPGLMTETVGMPETGEFDFLNYLLGLQVPENPTDLVTPQGENLFGPAFKSETGEGDRPLLELFDKKGIDLERQALAIGQTQAIVYQPTTKVDSAKDLTFREIEHLAKPETTKPNPEVWENKLGSFAQDILPQTATKEASTEQVSKLRKDGIFQKYSQADFKNLKEVREPQLALANDAFKQIQEKMAPRVGEDLESLDIPSEKKSRTDENDFTVDLTTLTGTPSVETPALEVKETKVSGHHTVPEMFQKVESMIHHGGGKMTVTLNPAALGQVEIQVKARGKNVEIEMKSESDSARMSIEGGLEELKASLQSQDLNLSRLEVHVTKESDSSFNEMAFNQFSGSQQGSQETWREAQSQSRNQRSWDHQPKQSVSTVRTVPDARPVRGSSSRLDIQI